MGTAKERPDPRAVMRVLEAAQHSVVVNLINVPMADRPEYCAALLPRLLELRAKTARPTGWFSMKHIICFPSPGPPHPEM
jgi:hypothetical protein